MPINLQSTNTVGTKGGVKMLLFGGAGAGKTRLCGTLPNPVIISAENGLMSLRHLNLPFIQVTKLADFDEAWKWASTSAEARKFASIAIDSVSEIAELVLAYQKGKTADGRKAYGETNDEVMRIVKNFRNLYGPNICITAKAERIAVEGGNSSIYGPMMPGKSLAQALPYDFDIVGHVVPATTPEGFYYSAIRTRGTHEGDLVKDRSGALAPWEMPAQGDNLPNLTTIINKITKG